MAEKIESGDWITGPFWQGAVQVVSIQPHPDHDMVTVHSPDLRPSRTYVLTPSDWEQVQRAIQADRSRVSFQGDPARFRLGIEARRLRMAHSIDPYAALNASRVDPLPHQFEAVYDHLLARPIVRALLAHDAGAGKTIMAGLVLKELKRRQAVRRILIVVPAGLMDQWHRELLTKFGEEFSIVSRDFMTKENLDSLDVWRKTDQAITSVAFARQKAMRQALESVEWDLVIVDEAHKMAAYLRPNGSIQRTQAYRLGEVLSRRATHFLLMTATPHKGDPDNYRLLIDLVDPQWGEATRYAAGPNPAVLRRTKEEMRKPNGEDLYPLRTVETMAYTLSSPEGDLLEQVQKYIGQRYDKAKSANRQSARFALLTLERRMASSPYALSESLKRIRARAEARLHEQRSVTFESEVGDWAEWEDLTEEERWEREARAEDEVAGLVDRRHLGAEIHVLDQLIDRTQALIDTEHQEKISELRKACDLWVGQRGQQIIIFTEFKDTLDYLRKCVHDWGYTTTEIHGKMELEDRRAAERAFWKGTARVLLATEAAGEGINLQCCHVMVNFDIPWNPCRLEQRLGRIHRYGQAASEVFVFNLVATNTMEGQVKETLLRKIEQMRKDLCDKVFDVVGSVLWGDELRDILERVALGETRAVTEAKQVIERAGQSARAAIEAERRITITAEPLDIAGFQRKQATFRAYRLSPETTEKFFRQAVTMAGGVFREFQVEVGGGRKCPGFDVSLPPGMRRSGRSRLTLSFWPEACSDDETEEKAVLFVAPGHWFFEALLDHVIAACLPDLNAGAVFFDIQPAGNSPYLVWFVQSHMRDGLDRHVTDLLACVLHQADQEEVTSLSTDILDAFDSGLGRDVETGIKQVHPMLAGQAEVADQCLRALFLPELATKRAQHRAALMRDRCFLEEGLVALADHLSMQSVDAYGAGDFEEGDRLADHGTAVQSRLSRLTAEMTKAEHLLLVSPEVLGVALVLPAPLTVAPEPEEGDSAGGFALRRDPEVEQAAMEVVMAYEAGQGRRPRDVHESCSWDIESDNALGVVVRYIEVKGRGPEDAAEVLLTEPEWEAARRLADSHWLYIVRLADKMIWMIQNPYAKLQPKELKRWLVRIGDASRHGQVVGFEPVSEQPRGGSR